LDSWVFVGISLGLAIWTKSTALIFAFPFCVWFGIEIIRRNKRQAGKVFIIMVVCVLLISFPHGYRNTQFYGNPLGPNYDGYGIEYRYTNQEFSLSLLAVNFVKNLSLHLGLPFSEANEFLIYIIENFSQALGVEINDPRISWGGYPFGISFSLDEDHAGNFLHLLFFTTMATSYGFLKKIRTKELSSLFFAILVGFILFITILKWQPWHSRLHLPLFLLLVSWSTNVFLRITQNRIVRYTILILMIFFSLPYIFLNSRRPLAGGSNILSAQRSTQYLMDKESVSAIENSLDILEKYECDQLGLITGWDDWEFPLWALADFRDIDVWIEHVFVENESKNIMQHFSPCGILVNDSDRIRSNSLEIDNFARILNDISLLLFIEDSLIH
jgi:hypothetical protein